MKAIIKEDCISCGKCVDICPDVFEMGDDIAEVLMGTIPMEFQKAARQAAEECPVSAIIIEE